MASAPFVLLTRPAEASARFAARLAARRPGLEVIVAPLQAVTQLAWQPPPQAAAALILTSQNAVDAAVRAGLSGRAYCVGRQTAERAERAGLKAISAGGDAADLVARIVADGSGTVWYLRGREVRGDVAGQLRQHGFSVFEQVVYEMAEVGLDPAARVALNSGRAVLLPLFSVRSAERATKVLADIAPPLAVLSLSDAVGGAAMGLPARMRLVARRPDADGMLEIVEEALNSGALS